MAVDTPARIAILGAGPIGLEAALYARFLGYNVDVFERGEVAENVRSWGHVRMFSPFGMNRSTLGLAAIAAQDESWEPPPDDALLTGCQWAEQYLVPLAQTDLLADHIRSQTTVVAVGREDLLKHEMPGDDSRGDSLFRILSVRREGQETASSADIVIDTTGVYGLANWLGPGGTPALGERQLRSEIEYGVPDVLGRAREAYANLHTLVVGSGYSAATSVVALAELARQAPETRVTWLTRRSMAGEAAGPIAEVPNDRLAERQQLAAYANELARGVNSAVEHRGATRVLAIERQGARFAVRFAETVEDASAGDDTPEGDETTAGDSTSGTTRDATFDRIIANVGFRPDNSIYSELQVQECYASQGLMRLAAARSKNASVDCLDQTSPGSQSLLNPEPNFYVLGAKSFGRDSRFLVAMGLAQIQELFAVIGDRADLDLYTGARGLL